MTFALYKFIKYFNSFPKGLSSSRRNLSSGVSLTGSLHAINSGTFEIPPAPLPPTSVPPPPPHVCMASGMCASVGSSGILVNGLDNEDEDGEDGDEMEDDNLNLHPHHYHNGVYVNDIRYEGVDEHMNNVENV